MTRIRRINVSQVEGENANSNDVNEIRPFGETAFYLDTDANPDRLVLMMFDGTRTDLKSKVLSPGILFGSNADSGDGAGLDTIKLIPDATLHWANGAYDNDQYLIVDPTGPDHIHLRAGGAQDDSGARLYIGGENSYFGIDSGQNPPVYVAANSNVWTFGTTGDMTFPSGLSMVPSPLTGAPFNGTTITQPNGDKLQVFSTGTGGGSGFGWIEDLTAPTGGVAAIDFNNNTANSASILTGSFSSNVYAWTFGEYGTLGLPGGGNLISGGYDVGLQASNDGSSTFGYVTINTQAPPVTYSVVQQTSPVGNDYIGTTIIDTPYIASIVPGMPITGTGITVPTTVDSVTGPDQYGTYIINLTPAIGQQLPYLDTYTIGDVSLSNNVWEFDSQGTIILPQGGVITEGTVAGNPTIELEPANPIDSSQKLVIKGGGPPVESHLHLTTGNLTMTSIFLGTDEHNVRTRVDGSVDITARDYIGETSLVWNFSSNANGYGVLDLPGEAYIQSTDDSLTLQSLDTSTSTSRGVYIGTNGGMFFFNGVDGYFSVTDDSLDLTPLGDTRLSAKENLQIITDSTSSAYTWNFSNSGNIAFPDSTIQSTAFTSTPTLDVLRIEDGVHERFQPLADATGNITHDCSSGHIFYHTSPDANWTANFTNLNLSNSYATSVTLVIAQGGTGYYPSNVQIEGAAQTISWQGNAAPTASTNRTDVVNFSILNSSNTYVVLGQLTGF